MKGGLGIYGVVPIETHFRRQPHALTAGVSELPLVWWTLTLG